MQFEEALPLMRDDSRVVFWSGGLYGLANHIAEKNALTSYFWKGTLRTSLDEGLPIGIFMADDIALVPEGANLAEALSVGVDGFEDLQARLDAEAEAREFAAEAAEAAQDPNGDGETDTPEATASGDESSDETVDTSESDGDTAGDDPDGQSPDQGDESVERDEA